MRFFRLALATLFLGAVVSVGLNTTGSAQTTGFKCDCMVYQPGAPGVYGHKTDETTCTVMTCYV